MTDVIVVGGGICGLQLGALLSADGQSVTVLEKLPHPGGRAFLWEKDGFTVDNGIHLIRFGPKSAMARVFAHLGKPIEFRAMGKSYVGFPDGRKVDFPTSPVGFLTTKLMGVGERLKTLGIMIKLRKLEPGGFLDTSVKDWMDRMGITGGVRQYLHLVSASMQVCPFLERASAGEMLLNMQSVLVKGYSAMYPVKGWRYIYDTLLREIGKNGEVRTGAKVKRVVVEGGKAVGVELETGERIGAERVVVNLPAQQVFDVVDPSLAPAEFVKLCRELTPTAGVSLDYGLKRRVSGDSGLWYLWEPMSFGMFTSNLCPELAPPGKQLLTWFVPANVSDMEDGGRAREIEENLERAIFKTFPGLEAAIEWRRALRLKMVDGVEVNVKQHRGKRPGYKIPGIDGLYLVGDSLQAAGAGGDVGHEAVLSCYREMTGREA
ncbi:MAG TPA: NAD(P)/FAD-dependent oxidoreductase [bacterium]|nr:NAD(P)/FAD-dependent oxidoreductase [bacterium]